MNIFASSPNGFWYTYGDFAIFFVLFGALLILAFEVWMLIDCIKNKHVPANHKLWWIIGMFLIHPFVAIAYLFARHNYNKQPIKK